jgi:hypothetical protein
MSDGRCPLTGDRVLLEKSKRAEEPKIVAPEYYELVLKVFEDNYIVHIMYHLSIAI